MYASRVASPAKTCWPTMPSVSRLNAYFSIRMAVGDFRVISSAHSKATSSNCSWSTTALTIPISSASAAS